MDSRKNDLRHTMGKRGLNIKLYFITFIQQRQHNYTCLAHHTQHSHTDIDTSTSNHDIRTHYAYLLRIDSSLGFPGFPPHHPLSPPVFTQLLRSTPSARAAPLCRYEGFHARARPPPPVPPPSPTRGREGCAPTHSGEDVVPADTLGVEGRREIEGEGEEGRPRSETC